MPRYDYRCADCRYEFELLQSISEAGSGTCPKCSGAGRRVYHAVPVIYKGSGFYTTDYARPKRQAEGRSGDSEDGKVQKDTNETKPTATDKSSGDSKDKGESAAKTGSESTSGT